MKDITGYTSVLYGTGSRRYGLGARWFHWVTAALVFAVIPLGWIFAEFKTKDAAKEIFEAPFPGIRDDYVNLHKTLGLVILAVVVSRLVFRIANRPPALPGGTGMVEKGLSHTTHWLLYLLLLVMPISGYILASSGNHPISILGLFEFPRAPISKDQGKVAAAIHVYAQFALYALFALHLAGAAWHVFVRRDGLLDRMLPRQANAE